MAIKLKPTKIKQSFYLLIPKHVADLIELKDNSSILFSLKKNKDKDVLEYLVEK